MMVMVVDAARWFHSRVVIQDEEASFTCEIRPIQADGAFLYSNIQCYEMHSLGSVHEERALIGFDLINII
jgi:hypothetical protein